MIFNFLNDIGNYASRVVGRHKDENGFVSTCAVSDGRLPFETAISHKLYGDGKIIVVDGYSILEEAQIGHKEWVNKFITLNLPEEITEFPNSELYDIWNSEVKVKINETL